jgi:hypothetical protein
VEIKDINSGSSSTQALSSPVAWSKAVVQDNKIVFFGAGSDNHEDIKFDIYDISTNSWSIGLLPMAIGNASIIAVNNTIYIAGVEINGIISNQVWKLQF